jgi:hypothetical protein
MLGVVVCGNMNVILVEDHELNRDRLVRRRARQRIAAARAVDGEDAVRDEPLSDTLRRTTAGETPV